MTDYNDGKWHGWNGGKKPESIHDKSIVEYVWHDMNFATGGVKTAIAGGNNGSSAWWHILRFRVIKPFREPRTFYVNEYPNSTIMPHLYCSEVDAGIGAGKNRVRAVKLIEVIE